MPRLARAQPPVASFDVETFLVEHGEARTKRYAKGAVLFTQGGQAQSVFYLREGAIKLLVLSASGKEAVVAMLSSGDFLGEGCLAGQPLRMATGTAVVPVSALRVPKQQMA